MTERKYPYMALDPGGTTGVAILESTLRIKHFQIGHGVKHHKELYKLITTYMPSKLIVERFDYRRKGNVDLIPREYIGICELYCQMTDNELIMQPQLKGDNGLWTDDKLRDCYLYEPGKPHANDAVRHMLYYVTTVEKEMKWIRLTKKIEADT